jgi:hypothetical protein
LKYSCIFRLLLLLFCAIPFNIAQSPDATISGLVVDPSGKVITDADIEILNSATGIHYSSKTNGAGIYTISILPPGQYRVQVSRIGFKTLIKDGIVLNVQSAVALNFTLPVGATSESITVEAGSSMINTTDASVSTVIDRKFVENIPLNGRSFQDLISMTPGVATQSPQASGQLAGYNGDFSVNGQRTESNYYTVDGVSANTSPGDGYGVSGPGNSGSLASSTALGTTQSLVSVDALQEFRVQSSTYSAEYGRTPGGQFSLSTRSGTNSFHGTAFDYLRNNVFDANDWFNNHEGKAMTALRQNDFGGTLGGPVWIPRLYDGRRHSFFFVSYEGLRLTQPQAATVQYVPDTFMRQKAPPVLQAILNAFPLQNGIDYGTSANPSLAQFIAPYSLPSRIDSTSVRFDQNLSSKLSVFFRYAHTPSSTETRSLSVVSQSQFGNDSYTLGATSQISSQSNNDLRIGFASAKSAVLQSIDDFGGAIPVDLRAATGLSAYSNSYPEVLIEISGIGYGLIQTRNPENKSRQWNLVDTFSLSSGRHSIKLGMDYRRIVSPIVSTSPQASAFYLTGAAVIGNSANLLQITKVDGSTPVFNELAAFVQDQWHLAPRLSLSGGIRWEIDPPPTEAHGNYPYTLLGDINNPSTLTLAPKGTPIWKTSWYNFAPRLGLAWTAQPHPEWETVLRVGAGVFFDTNNQLAVNGFTTLGYKASKTYASASLPITTSQLNFEPSANPPYTSAAVYAYPNHLQLPYTWQWNASLEQAVGPNQSIVLSYVGSNGRRLAQTQQMSVAALNPLFGTVVYVPNGATSNYQALQLQFKRSLHHGFQALASYTWAHSIDFGSNDSAFALTRADSDFDLRHNVQGGISWDVPDASRNKVVGAMLNHWGLDGRIAGRTAFPITLQGNLYTDPASGRQYYSGLNTDPTKPVYLHGALYPGGKALNKAAFTLPGAGQSGNAPRNFVRGFGASQVNLAVRRQFQLHDSLALQFRAEAFNTLNQPNFGYVDPIYTDITFGQATMMLNSSLGTVASQYQQGGARSMQFALKVIF